MVACVSVLHPKSVFYFVLCWFLCHDLKFNSIRSSLTTDSRSRGNSFQWQIANFDINQPYNGTETIIILKSILIWMLARFRWSSCVMWFDSDIPTYLQHQRIFHVYFANIYSSFVYIYDGVKRFFAKLFMRARDEALSTLRDKRFVRDVCGEQ